MSSTSRTIASAAIVLAFVAAGCADDPVGTFCGNGRLDPGEACDDGRGNSDTVSGACRTNCALPSCGDGVADPGEGCDDGADNSDLRAGACRESCVLAGCGDGVIDPWETCDDGPENGVLARCRPNCVLGTCGDGVLDPGEECDEGAWNDDDAVDVCRTSCLLPYCGDGVIDTGESCDEGAENDDRRRGACRTSCIPAGCGDGVIDPGEECDDGPWNDDRYPGFCRTDCRLPHCGDGVLDEGEACDEGEGNDDFAPGACRTGCLLPRCGDGIHDPREECDEGDENDDFLASSCRTDCRLPYCGDGVPGGDEECDEGAGNDDLTPGACRTNCRLAYCGDGVRDEGEQCDDGAWNSDTALGACRTTCRFPRCGDGVVDAGESCDDGEPGAADGCTAGCELAFPATCFDPARPVHDLREVGTPDGGGFVVSGVLFEEEGLVSLHSCPAGGHEVFYSFPVTVPGDLVVEVEPSPSNLNEKFAPTVAVRRGCVGNELACAGAEQNAVRLIVTDVSPAEGVYVIQVDSKGSAAYGDFTLRVDILPTLAEGDPCAVSGALGRCAANSHVCFDPDGDDDGRCLPLVDEGSACDPAANACREPTACRDGRCGPSCGDGIHQPWERCDDGNTDDNDGCTSTCEPSRFNCAGPLDLTSRWDPIERHVTWTGSTEALDDNIWYGPCDLIVGADAVATFVAPETGRYFFRGPRGALAILEACDGRSRILGCPEMQSAISKVEGVWLDLVAGEKAYLAVAGSYESGYGFNLQIDRPICGDGIVQGPETCDDGNTDGGDGCRADCQFEGDSCADPYPLAPDGTGPAMSWQGSLGWFGNDIALSCLLYNRVDVVASFTAPAAGRYSFRAQGSSGSDPSLGLAVRTGSCSEGPELACELTSSFEVPAAVAADLDAGQTAWIIVRSDSRNDFTLLAGPVICGDGVRLLPEECDDGNRQDGDGCDASCRVEAVPEVEPNDVRAMAQPLAIGRALRGNLGAGDVDYVALGLTAGAGYEFELFNGGWERCEKTGGALVLHGPTGEIVASDSKSGIGGCARLAFTAPTGGTYFLRVTKASSYPLPYLLRTAVVTP